MALRQAFGMTGRLCHEFIYASEGVWVYNLTLPARVKALRQAIEAGAGQRGVAQRT